VEARIPRLFAECKSRTRSYKTDTFCTHSVGFFDVVFALFTGNHGFLADRYVNIGQKKRTREEVIALLKQRLAPLKHTSDGSGEWKRGEAE
jgi:hypothetical protein